MVTIFTPTYNRAYILPQLYESLCRQTCNDFEWLIVDDGSNDKTEELLETFISEQKINIRYYKQANGGKHRAINRGVNLAQGELFFIVDSDDYLTDDAVEWVESEYKTICSDKSFAGLSGCRQTPNGKRIGGDLPFDLRDCNMLDFRMKYGVQGDMAEVYVTKVLKEYPFEEIDGEKFCPEALVWNRIAQEYVIRWVNKGIYVCEYLPDGLTAHITRLRMNSPKASKLYYSELYRSNISVLQKVKSAVNFWRFALCSNSTYLEDIGQIGLEALLLLPIGWIMHINDLYR